MSTPRPDPTIADRADDSGPRPLQVAFAGLLGTFIEFYDFTVYGFLVVYLAPQFFPASDETAGILATLGVFGAGYLARPLGAAFFGRLGDRHGRRITLLVTITGMGAATTVMGLLPTYAAAGVIAPVLLVLTRLAQGFSAGGEIAGASTFIAESDGGRNRGTLQAFIPLGSALGVAVAPAVVGLAGLIVGADAMAAWGWRIPLLLSAVMATIVVVYRARIDDSIEFRSLAAARAIERSPVRAAVRGHWRMILATATLNLVVTMILGVLVNYMNVYLIGTLELPDALVYWLSAVCLLFGTAGILLGGWWIDRFGRRSAMLLGCGGAVVLIFPVFSAMAEVATGGTWALIVAGVLYLLVLAFVYSATPVLYVTLSQAFPTQVRYTSSALAYNVGAVLGGGLTPYLAAQITEVAGPRAAAWLVVVAAVVGVSVVLGLTSRRRRPSIVDAQRPA